MSKRTRVTDTCSWCNGKGVVLIWDPPVGAPLFPLLYLELTCGCQKEAAHA